MVAKGGEEGCCSIISVLSFYECMTEVCPFWLPKGERKVQPIPTNTKTDLEYFGVMKFKKIKLILKGI